MIFHSEVVYFQYLLMRDTEQFCVKVSWISAAHNYPTVRDADSFAIMHSNDKQQQQFFLSCKYYLIFKKKF